METKNIGRKNKETRRKKKTYQVRKRFGCILFVLIVTAALFFVAVQAYENYLNHNLFYENIYIDGYPIGGLTKEQAIEQLTPIWQGQREQVNIRLVHGEQEWTFDHNDIQLTSNHENLLEEAYDIGRGKDLLARISEIYGLRSNPAHFSSKITYQSSVFEPWLNELADELNLEPIDATISFHPGAEEMFEITKEQLGRALQKKLILTEVENNLSQDNFDFSIQLKFQEVKPQIYVDDFTGKTEKLVTFGTDLSSSAADRTHNVVQAALEFNGVVLQPDEVLSFNGLVGERTAAKGYRSAPMIVADKSLQNAVGGGVSQTSSTLYNAAIRAGLDVIEYRRHSFPVAYIGKGLDTTVNLPTPVIDIKVKNTRPSPIYFKTFYVNQKVYFEIYGEPLPNGRTIRIRTDEYGTVSPSSPEIRQDHAGSYVTYKDQRHTHVAPRNGYKVRVYREYLEGDEVVETELLDDHYYRPIAGIVYVGVKDRPDPQPQPSPDSDFTPGLDSEELPEAPGGEEPD